MFTFFKKESYYFLGQITFTRYNFFDLPLSKGIYSFSIESLQSSDVDDSKCILRTKGTNENDIYVQVDRGSPQTFILELYEDIQGFWFYAATTAEKSTGDTVIIKNFIIKKINQISKNNQLIKNPYSCNWYNNNLPVFTELISTCHCHYTGQLDNSNKGSLEDIAREYGHIVISNYYPSTPRYPLKDFDNNVPSNLISSPGAEFAHFFYSRPDYWNHSCHFGSVGSFLTKETDFCDIDYINLNKQNNNSLQFNYGGMIINHPKASSLTKKDIITILNRCPNIFGMEIYNSSCEINHSNGFSTDIWDEVLSMGVQIFGTASPDHQIEFNYNNTTRRNTYGKNFGYNHLLVRSKNEQEAIHAYKNGLFYSSVFNDSLKFTNIKYLSTTGLNVETSENCTIKIISAEGEVLTSNEVNTLNYTPTSQDIYLRIEATNGTNTLYSNAIIL